MLAKAAKMDRISATYLIETPLPVEQAADSLAGEQSYGTFVVVPGETEALKHRFGARVEKIRSLGTVSQPSLPGCRFTEGPFERAEIVVSWPHENAGFNLPALISIIQGNLYELSQFSGLKLLDLELPRTFARHFHGPKFGVAGTRQLASVQGRPLIGTIIKPSIGLSPSQTANCVEMLAEAGIDFIKDDELMANPPHSPFDERVDAVMRVIKGIAGRIGKKVMYAFNISDEMDAMLRHYEKIVSAGGTAAMVSLNSVGLAAVKRIGDLGALAIHGHRNGWGMLSRHPLLGIEFPAYQKIWRLAGVDQIHVNGIANKFCESDDSVVRSIESCLKPLVIAATDDTTEYPAKTSSRADSDIPILPVVSSGQWGGQAPELYRRTKTTDLLYLAGGGILAHPDGPAAGVRSLQRWWQAAVEGLTMGQAAAKYSELKKSLETFGKKN